MANAIIARARRHSALTFHSVCPAGSHQVRWGPAPSVEKLILSDALGSWRPVPLSTHESYFYLTYT
eukprot:1211310-Prymnesium_polylepis.1